MVFCTGCAGCGCVELDRKLCELYEGYCSTVVHGLCSRDDGHNDARNMLR